MTTAAQPKPAQLPVAASQAFLLTNAEAGGTFRCNARSLAEARILAFQEVRRCWHLPACWNYVNIFNADAAEREICQWRVALDGQCIPVASRCVPNLAFTRDGRAVRTGDTVKIASEIPGCFHFEKSTVQHDPRFARSIFTGTVSTAECFAA